MTLEVLDGGGAGGRLVVVVHSDVERLDALVEGSDSHLMLKQGNFCFFTEAAAK